MDSVPAETEFTDDMRRVVSGWQNRLLQLDRSNSLLYFKESRTSVRLLEQSPDQLTQQLISSRRGLKFDYVEPKSTRRSDPLRSTTPPSTAARR